MMRTFSKHCALVCLLVGAGGLPLHVSYGDPGRFARVELNDPHTFTYGFG
jgi:hypothetical protein